MHLMHNVPQFFAIGLLLSASHVVGAQEVQRTPTLSSPAMLRISRLQENGQFDAEEFRIYKATQGQLARSAIVLDTVLRNPEIQTLPVIEKWGDRAVRQLRRSMTVDFPGDAEIMTIAIEPPDMSDTQAAKLTNAVVNAFIAEVVNAERLEQVAERDALQQIFERSNEELRRKRTSARKLQQEFGPSAAAMAHKVRLQTLSELVQRMAGLEEDRKELLQSAATGESRSSGQKAIDQKQAELISEKLVELRKEVEGLTKLIDRHATDPEKGERYSADIVGIQDEVAALQDTASRLRRKLHDFDVELTRPPRIRLVQKAEP